MIWIEILSRHRDIAARFRIPGPEARIGRGYDNDVILDDPYVAAQHLRVFRDETGQLVAEDLGSANGMFLDGGKSRLARVVIDGKQPIRIGQTFLRVRETSHAVERERVATPERPMVPILLALALGLTIVMVEELDVWLSQTAEPRISLYLTPLLGVGVFVLVWVGGWALLCRILSGRSHFLRNLLIALAGVLAFSLYNEFGRFAGFAWTWPVAASYEYVALWSILAAVCFFHLREVGQRRLVLKGVVVATLLVTAIAVQTLQRSEAFSDSGRQFTARRLLPPEFRLVPLRDENAFFGEIENLKAKLDADRRQAKPDEAGR
jgi:pSer/pThr/pTyr-binding forkhead associated (FHA) protein